MSLLPHNLTFGAMREAYVAALQGRDGKALMITSRIALFLNGANLYSVAVGPAGSVETASTGSDRLPTWDDYLGCWESDEDPETTVAAVNSPVFVDIGTDQKGRIAMLTYSAAMATYRSLLELNPGKALRLNEGENVEAAALVDGELCSLLVGSDNVADLSTVNDLIPEAWGVGGWHSEVEETCNALDNPVFVDISY